MGAAKKKTQTVQTEDEIEVELENLISEHSVITDRIDALEIMKKQRKERILVLMRDQGRSNYTAKAGAAGFTVRRSFKVLSPERLASMMSPLQLASLVKITADVYDAMTAEGKSLDEAVQVGSSESLSVSRAKTKAAKERRKAHIDESRRQAEKRITQLREQFRSNA